VSSSAPVAPAASADLEVAGLSKRFAAHLAVDDLSFSVARGSFFSILGPSGCGKTTLLRMIAGFIQADRGAIRIGGQDMTRVAPNRRPVNMVFQHLALFPMMSVAQNVAFGLARRGVGRAERLRRAAAMLERVGLAGVGARRTDELSGGQRQRVAIARSMVLEPTLLLLDEPLGALDLKLREHMKIELKQLQSTFGTTFVYITHDQSEALVLSDQVAVMNHGRFEQLGAPQQLYYSPASAFVAGFVGANNRIPGKALTIEAGVVELVTAGGWAVRARAAAATAVGAEVQAFIRPENMSLAVAVADLPAGHLAHRGEVSSLLFDGANSTVLVRELQSGLELRVALPPGPGSAQLRPGARVHFGHDPQLAVCFGGGAAHG
jgi:spermidine/putrescine transport system ATP-binding protein